VRTHPFDPVAFVFGVIFVAVAAVGLTDLATITLTDLRWIGPAALVLVGIVLVISAARTADQPRLDDGEAATDHDQS
jgi:branched-subunit amino acid permease